jgi:hypothetical protein
MSVPEAISIFERELCIETIASSCTSRYFCNKNTSALNGLNEKPPTVVVLPSSDGGVVVVGGGASERTSAIIIEKARRFFDHTHHYRQK